MARKEQYAQILQAVRDEHPALTIELAKRYLARFPDEPWVLMYFGMALQHLARYAEAEAIFERARAVLPPEEHERVDRQLGDLARDEGKLQEAEAWYRRAMAAKPDDATAFIYLGAMLAKAGRLVEAEAVHRAATECPEGCIDEAYENLGLVLRAQGRYLEALEALREAARRDPLDTRIQADLEDLDRVLFRFPEA